VVPFAAGTRSDVVTGPVVPILALLGLGSPLLFVGCLNSVNCSLAFGVFGTTVERAFTAIAKSGFSLARWTRGALLRKIIVGA
jgi:hypothetical protein